MRCPKRIRGFTLLEALIASTLVCGALATLGLWSYKGRWNQSALHRQKALELLRHGIETNALHLPDSSRTWSEYPASGWRIEWSWKPLPQKGWMLEGVAYGASERNFGRLWIARWRP